MTTISEWLFSDNSRPIWVEVAVDELNKCKPVAGLGVFNSTRQDCEEAAAQAVAREIVGCMRENDFPIADAEDDVRKMRDELSAIASDLVREAIARVPWWTDSDALFAETGLRHSDK